MKHFDVIIVGAGLSGIGAACQIQKNCPGTSYQILESREVIGGTWDLFRYPGVRSDSDMYTLGYSFRPWRNPAAIASGREILKYIKETATEHDVQQNIRFGHKVVEASWNSREGCWTLTVTTDGEHQTFTCGFIFSCSGYYRYDRGYKPDLPGQELFKGKIVHPQKWSDKVIYKNKKVVIIGSGATTVTMAPELAKEAESVVILQRSPSYLWDRSSEDAVAKNLSRVLPNSWVYNLARWKNILVMSGSYSLAKTKPAPVRKYLLKLVKTQIEESCETEKHFNPDYNPWDQRVCVVSDGDLFKAIRDGRIEMVTDGIKSFTPEGLVTKSEQELKADLVVMATGLELEFMGGIKLKVDGKTLSPSELTAYRGVMLSDVPNLAIWMGYTNSSWTLKAELTGKFICRLLKHMRKNNTQRVVPRMQNPAMDKKAFMDLTSGYVQRSSDQFPNQGKENPWRIHQSFFRDYIDLNLGKLQDGVLEFD